MPGSPCSSRKTRSHSSVYPSPGARSHSTKRSTCRCTKSRGRALGPQPIAHQGILREKVVKAYFRGGSPHCLCGGQPPEAGHKSEISALVKILEKVGPPKFSIGVFGYV